LRDEELAGYKSNPAIAGLFGARRKWTALFTSGLLGDELAR
jgi:hypothetical protein